MHKPTNLREALLVKSRVYEALMIRLIIVRFGRENLGFLWVIIEPMLLCVGVMGIWKITKGESEHGLTLSAVVFTGYMPLTLWRHMTNSMVYWLRYNKQFTIYHNVELFDLLMSRLFLEFVSVTASALVVYAVLSELGILPYIHNWALIFEGWMIMASLGFGGGILIAALSETSEIVEKFVPPFQYFMLPFSGCFFLLDWLPDKAREAVSYTSWVHSFETFRAGYFGPAVQTYGNPPYAFALALATAGLGCFIFEKIKNRVDG